MVSNIRFSVLLFFIVQFLLSSCCFTVSRTQEEMYHDSVFVVKEGGMLTLGEYDNMSAAVFYDEKENQLVRVSTGLKNVSVFSLDNWKLKNSSRITNSDFSGSRIYPLGTDILVRFQQFPPDGIFDIKFLFNNINI